MKELNNRQETVLQYICNLTTDNNGKIYFNESNYTSIPEFNEEEIFLTIIFLADMNYFTLRFVGQKKKGKLVTITLSPKAVNYNFIQEQIKHEGQKAIWKFIGLTFRDIVLLAIGAIFGGIVTLMIAKLQ